MEFTLALEFTFSSQLPIPHTVLLTRNIDVHAFPIRLIAWNHSTFGVNQPIHSHKRIKCLVCRRYCNKRILKPSGCIPTGRTQTAVLFCHKLHIINQD